MRSYSSSELYVLAALLGARFIIGVEKDTYDMNLGSLNDLFLQSYSSLESKGIIEYKLDGTLFMNHETLTSVRLLYQAEKVLQLTTNIHGEVERIDYLLNEEGCCYLKRELSGYSVDSVNEKSYESILMEYGINLTHDAYKQIDIDLNTLKYIADAYKSFNAKEADEYIISMTDDEELRNLIRQCISDKAKYFVLKEYSRKNECFIKERELFAKCVEDRILVFSLKDTSIVNIRIYKKEN